VVGDVCTVVVTSVTVGLVVLTDTVVGPWVDVLTSGEVVVVGTAVGNNFTRSQHIYSRTNNSISQYHKSDCN
jgi:hypothetical protein